MKKIFKLIPAITSIGLIATPSLLFVTSCGESKNYEIKEMSAIKTVKHEGSAPTYEVDFKTNVLRKKGSSMTYISLDEAFKVIKKIHNEYVFDNKYDYQISKEGNNYIVKRENGATLTISSYYDTLTFDDYNLFMCEGTAKPSSCARDYGELGNYTDDNITSILAWGSIDYRIRKEKDTVFNLSTYGINMLEWKNELYLPFQTVSDIFLADLYRPLTALKDIIICPWEFKFSSGATIQYPEIISNNKIDVDQELLNFNYNELCLFMDINYGLAEEKQVDSFDKLFEANNLKTKMLQSVDGFEEGLDWIIGYFMDDGHSNLLWLSPMTGQEGKSFQVSTGACGQWRSNEITRYRDIRHKTYPATAKGEETVPGYYEPANAKDTVVITFDRFSNSNIDYYAPQALPEDPNDAKDCIGLFLSAYQKIQKNNDIKNVIVDISCNGGGDVKACMIISAMLAGGQFKNVWKSTIDNSINVCGYYTDANLDHKIDDNDFALKDKNIYVLTSTYSFSCANMLPTNIFQLPNCHVVGKRSGGGACIVLPSSSGIGTGFRMSGPYKHGYLKNGVFYYNDEGIEPEYYIEDEIYYRKNPINPVEEREDLIKYIKELQ